MDNNRARQPARRADRGDSWAFDLIAAKLMRPLTRDGTVRRALLIDRLRRDGSRPIVSVVAPAGYGKTTLLSQWAERNGQAHMSLPEIAAQLSLSQNTVKSQAYSLYRKLGATSRSQAIARSRELTLLEPA